MNTRTLQSDLILLLTAAIWGFGFVAQRAGMDELGPFGFNAARFLLGSLSLLPLIWWFRRRQPTTNPPPANRGLLLWGSLLAGALLFTGSTLQQIGLLYTTAGKAGFITGLYLIFVPLLGLIGGQRTGLNTWLGATLAVAGLFLLSGASSFSLAYGDLLVLIGALFWAGHVLVIGWLSSRVDVLLLSLLQCLFSALCSLAVALGWETFSLAAVTNTLVPILYAGILSVGVAYTLQIVGQRHAPPAHAAILLSLEAVFALLGGWLLLDEALTPRILAGCALMLAGMLLSQINLGKLLRRSKSDSLPTSATDSIPG